MNWVRHGGSAAFETKSGYCRAAWQGLPCYTAVARLGFKRRATAVLKSNLIRSTEFGTAVALRLKWPFNTLARLMNNEKKNHTMKSIQVRTKGKEEVDQVQRHEWLRATVTRHHCCSGRLKNSGVFFSKSVLQGAKLILRFYPQSKPFLCPLASARSEPMWKSELFCRQLLRANFQ